MKTFFDLIMDVNSNSKFDFTVKQNADEAKVYADNFKAIDNLKDGSYRGSVLLPDGLLLVMPHNKNEGDGSFFQLFDYKTDKFTPLPFGATGNYRGGVLLNDTEVLCIPKEYTNAAIYHHDTRTLEKLDNFIGTFIGSCLLPDGNVLCIPYHNTEAQLYHTDTRELEPLGFSGKFYGCIPNYDCSVILIPPFQPETNFVLYYPETKTHKEIPNFDGKWCSGMLMPNGKALIVSGSEVPSQIYDFETEELKPVNLPLHTYRSAKIMPTGHIFCMAKNMTKPVIYNYVDDSSVSVNIQGNFINGQTLPDGRILALPKGVPLEVPHVFGKPVFNEQSPKYEKVMKLLTSRWCNKY